MSNISVVLKSKVPIRLSINGAKCKREKVPYHKQYNPTGKDSEIVLGSLIQLSHHLEPLADVPCLSLAFVVVAAAGGVVDNIIPQTGYTLKKNTFFRSQFWFEIKLPHLVMALLLADSQDSTS
jgi:hypothetical protein